MNNNINWYNITKKYNDIDYNYGSWEPENGLDCLSMVLTFLKDTGVDIEIFKTMEYEYQGKKINMFNYHEILDSIKEGSTVLKHFIKDTFEKVDVLTKGNIIFYPHNQVDIVGVYLGNGIMMATFADFGLKNIKIDINLIKGAYTWRS